MKKATKKKSPLKSALKAYEPTAPKTDTRTGKVKPLTKKEQLAKTRINKERMLKALEENLGIVTSAAKQADVSRAHHYTWMANDPEYKAQVDALENMTLDVVENQLMNLIKEGDVKAVLFYMRTKGRSRGYVERTELTGKDGADLAPKEIKLTVPDASGSPLMKKLTDKLQGGLKVK